MKYNPTSKYKVQCRAILKHDHTVRGNEIEKVRKEFEERFKGRKDILVYFMITKVAE